MSQSTDLVTGVTRNGGMNVYVRDLANGVTQLATAVAAGKSPLSYGTSDYYTVLSADGRYVGFSSYYTNLLPDITTSGNNVFVRDLVNGTITLVSVNAGGTGNAAGNSQVSAISPDGRYVAFTSVATDLTAVPGNGKKQAYERDLQTGTTYLVSIGTDGNVADADVENLSLTPNGRYLVFNTAASNLTPLPTNGKQNVYERDLQTGTTYLVSVNSTGDGGGNADSPDWMLWGDRGAPSVSADGRYVAFTSKAMDLTPNTPTGVPNLFVRDVAAGVTTLETPAAALPPGSSYAYITGTFLSTDGRYVAFGTDLTNLVTNGSNVGNVYVRDRTAGTTILASHRDATLPSVTASGKSQATSLSADGRYVAFVSSAANLTALPAGGDDEVYVRDLTTGAVTLVSVNAAGTAGDNGDAGYLTYGCGPMVSGDGRFVVFVSNATDLTALPTDAKHNVYVRDLKMGLTTLVSANAAGTGGGNNESALYRGQAISADGRYVVFESYATDLIPGVSTPAGAVFVRDLVLGTTTLVTIRQDGIPAGGSFNRLSPDGRYVLFTSSDSGLTSQPNGGRGNTYLRDLQTSTTVLVSANADGTAGGNAASSGAVMTPDGGFVVFSSKATDLVAGGSAYLNYEALFVRDLRNATTTLVGANGAVTSNPTISDDGRYVEFLLRTGYSSYATVHVLDRQTGVISQVDVTPAGAPGSGGYFGARGGAAISADGRFVVFTNDEKDLTSTTIRIWSTTTSRFERHWWA